MINDHNVNLNYSGFDKEPWQLDYEFYEPAFFEPVLIHPRPVTETNNWERHRLAPNGVPWSIPVSIHGGSWPFHHEIDEASYAKGIRIGQDLAQDGVILKVPEDYGVVSWDNPTIGEHEITITVKTQEYGRNVSGKADSITFTFTLVVADRNDISKFWWIAGTGNDDTGDGSFDSPWRTVNKAMLSGFGRQLHIKAGQYNTSTALGAWGNYPRVMVGYDQPTIEITQSRGWASGSAGGHYVSGLKITTSPSYSTDNHKIFWIDSKSHRATFFNVISENPTNGVVGNDNPSTIHSPSGSTNGINARNYITINRCTETGRTMYGTNGLNDGDNGCGLFVLFGADYGVVEFNYVNSSSRNNMDLKDSNRHWTVRCNVHEGPAERSFMTACQLQSYPSTDIELCYNYARSAYYIGNAQNVMEYGTHVFHHNSGARISFLGASVLGAGPVIMKANAVREEPSGSQILSTDNECVGQTYNSKGGLKDQFRIDWLGRRGSELVKVV